MSRIAKSPIPIPNGVNCKIIGATVFVEGKLGKLSLDCPAPISVQKTESPDNSAPFLMIIDNAFEELKARFGDKADPKSGATAKAGLVRALVNNMVVGVSEGFECKLELHGVGYRAKVSGSTLELSLGFSHPVKIEMPKGISADCPKQTEIAIRGADKQLVFQIGANIRAKRPPEPYKGKGIRYAGEHVRRKEVKKK